MAAPKKKPKPAVNVAKRFAALEAERAAQMPSPYLSPPTAVIYVALSVLILSYSWMFDVVPILILLLMWASPLLTKGFHVLRPSRAMAWVLALPALCILSTIWSGYPATTLYLATAFLAMMACTIIAHRVVKFPALAQGLVIGISITLLLSLISNKYAMDSVSKTYALVGYFGSKNTVGFTAEMGLLTSIILFFSSRGFIKKLLLAVIPFIICAYSLYLCRSATALITLIGVIGIIAALYALTRMSRQLRLLSLVIGFFLVVPLTVGSVIFDGKTALLKAMGKDPTLTGRTYLWEEGTKIGWEKPLLGHGYSAFWVRGEPRAEHYWQEFAINARMGFHFHSTFIQSFVDVGFVGLAVITLLMLLSVFQALRAAIRHHMHAESAWLLAFSAMFLTRAFVEIDMLGPFGIGAMLFFGILVRAEALNAARKAVPIKAPKGAKQPSGKSAARAVRRPKRRA